MKILPTYYPNEESVIDEKINFSFCDKLKVKTYKSKFYCNEHWQKKLKTISDKKYFKLTGKSRNE